MRSMYPSLQVVHRGREEKRETRKKKTDAAQNKMSWLSKFHAAAASRRDPDGWKPEQLFLHIPATPGLTNRYLDYLGRPACRA